MSIVRLSTLAVMILGHAHLIAQGTSLVQSRTDGTVSRTKAEGGQETVSGTVRNRVSREPIAHVKVRFSGVKDGSVYTAPDGRFRIDDVPYGKIRPEPAKIGFFDTYSFDFDRQREEPVLPEFAVGPGNNDFNLVMVPGAKIVGRITEGSGTPVKNTLVQVAKSAVVKAPTLSLLLGFPWKLRTENRHRM